MELESIKTKNKKSFFNVKNAKYRNILNLVSPKKASRKSLSKSKINQQNLDVVESKYECSTDSIYSTIDNKNMSTAYPSPVPSNLPVYSSVKKLKCNNCPEKEEIKNDKKLLQERCREMAEENRQLRKQIEDILLERKREDDRRHSLLQSQMTRLETDTKHEVNSLKERVGELVREKLSLQNQVSVLNQEKEELVHQQIRQAEASRQKHEESILFLKKHLEEVESEKESLKESLEASEKQRRVLRRQSEETSDVAQHTQQLLAALLLLVENLTMERDILLSKSSFQEHQQKELHNSFVDHTLSFGKLQEHISNWSHEMAKLQNQKSNQPNNAGRNARQTALLREKIVSQNDLINQLQRDKSKLEMQLQTNWDSLNNGFFLK